MARLDMLVVPESGAASSPGRRDSRTGPGPGLSGEDSQWPSGRGTTLCLMDFLKPFGLKTSIVQTSRRSVPVSGSLKHIETCIDRLVMNSA